MILITGPTGSGKSTTLYSVINQLNTIDRNIITIEDPVEYQVEGITQIQARADIGLTFASGLRSILRQSPDIIMVGEIRDAETADIAIKASLTGEIVLSTLHTNDAAGAITRLVDMGVEPFLVASSLVMVGAQRLCRKMCQNCKEEYDAPQSILDRLGIDRDKFKKELKAKFLRGKGCSKCNNSGYYGRIAILEAFLVDDTIRGMIVSRAMQGMGLGLPGLIINLVRLFVVAIPLAYLFVFTLGFGYLSVAVAMVIGAASAALIASSWIMLELKKF